jgi:predicted transcriptional regulator
MDETAHRLITLKVKDVMSRDVSSISPNQMLSEVATILMANHISGAPVVDDRGRCVGVLSALDYVKREGDQQRPEQSAHDVKVHEMMSTDFQFIRPEQTMLDAARLMCVKHVHRLPVVAANQLLVGLITSMDITAALVNAIDEHEANTL